MPLQWKCNSCHRMLVLDEVFQGARCRCKYCRSLVSVPAAATKAPRSAQRPDRPTLTRLQVPAVFHSAKTAPRRTPGGVIRSITGRITPLRIAASFTLFSSALLGAHVWRISDSTSRTSAGLAEIANVTDGTSAAANESLQLASVDPARALNEADPTASYFGIPFEGDTIGYVIDSDVAIAPYMDRLAFVTNSITSNAVGGDYRFGIVQAAGKQDSAKALEVLDPSADPDGAGAALRFQPAPGDTDLSAALAVADGWRADALFLVVAKRLTTAEIDSLAAMAEQTGATTHVIALGNAANDMRLAQISSATDGQFVAVTDDVLNSMFAIHLALINPHP